MQGFPPERLRNLVLLSHTGAGKTSLAEALLFRTGAISRQGRVEEGNTTSDYDPEEIKRQTSIQASILPCPWMGYKVNLIDTPGFFDFVGEVRSALRAADAALILVCAASGVEVGTERSWRFLGEHPLPAFLFINKMDRENADFLGVVRQLQERFGRRCVPLHLPIGFQASFEGVVDLLEMKAHRDGQAEEVPPSLLGQARELRERLVEAVAETDDALANKFLEGEELTLEELRRGLKQGISQGQVVPILAGSSLQNRGTSLLLDTLAQFSPSPLEHLPKAAQDSSSLIALAFKTTVDPYIGKLTYLRLFSGTLQSDSRVWNANKGKEERIGQLYLLRGKTQIPVSQLVAGDIGAVAKLGETNTGDTLCQREKSVTLEPIQLPPPVFSAAIYPKSRADLDRLGTALARLCEEDPTLKVRRDADTAETLLSGLGDVHIAVATEKLKQKFGVEVLAQPPKVPYRETITATVSSEYKHKKQTGGHGQYGHVFLRLEPLPRGDGFEFASAVVGGVVPKNYVPAVERGVREAVQDGVLAHYPMVDIKVTLYDGSYHPVDSSDISFKIAASHALTKGVAQAQPVLLEPILSVQVTVPDAFTGDIMSDLNGKRARVLGMNPEGGYTVIEALVPQAEMLRYATDLRAMTQGRGSYSAEFSHYEGVPPHLAQRITEEARAKQTKS